MSHVAKTDTNTAARDAACEHYIENDCYAMDGYEPHRASFKAGWDARDEEVRRLKEENERLKEELSALKNPSDARCMEIGMLREQREKLQAQVERLKAALEDRDRRECAKGV